MNVWSKLSLDSFRSLVNKKLINSQAYFIAMLMSWLNKLMPFVFCSCMKCRFFVYWTNANKNTFILFSDFILSWFTHLVTVFVYLHVCYSTTLFVHFTKIITSLFYKTNFPLNHATNAAKWVWINTRCVSMGCQTNPIYANQKNRYYRIR